MMVVFITFMVLSVVIIGWCVWMDEQIDNDVEFPESELEKSTQRTGLLHIANLSSFKTGRISTTTNVTYFYLFLRVGVQCLIMVQA